MYSFTYHPRSLVGYEYIIKNQRAQFIKISEFVNETNHEEVFPRVSSLRAILPSSMRILTSVNYCNTPLSHDQHVLSYSG